jgi:hypothetical protein
LSAFGVYFTSMPTCGLAPSSTSGAPVTSSRGCASAVALTYGAATRCPPPGRCSIPTRTFDRQTKQLPPRGILAEKNW